MEVNVDSSAKVSVSNFFAEKLDIALSLCVSQFLREYPTVTENLKMSIWEDKLTRALVFSLRSFLLDGHKLDHTERVDIKTPATPWQFFKQQYMPGRFLRHWPVRFVTQQVTTVHHHHYMCPHMSVPSDKPHHVYWMMQGTE